MEGQLRDLAIEIQCLEKKWTEMLRNVKPPEEYDFHIQCIYGVPPTIRENNLKAYTPQIVSIGPYHYNSFESMEELKLKYLKEFLNQKQIPMREFIVKMKEIEEIQLCYAEPIKYNSDNFLKLILVDAYFIIELFIRSFNDSDWEGNDPLVSNDWMLSDICDDLGLLENQLPFFVLEKIYNLTGMREKFLDITFSYFRNISLGKVCPRNSPTHFIDLLRSSIISSSELDVGKWEKCKEVNHLYNASQLEATGLSLRSVQTKAYLT